MHFGSLANFALALRFEYALRIWTPRRLPVPRQSLLGEYANQPGRNRPRLVKPLRVLHGREKSCLYQIFGFRSIARDVTRDFGELGRQSVEQLA